MEGSASPLVRERKGLGESWLEAIGTEKLEMGNLEAVHST